MTPPPLSSIFLCEAVLQVSEGGVGGDPDGGEAEAAPEAFCLGVAGDVAEVGLLCALGSEAGCEVADEGCARSPSPAALLDVDEGDEADGCGGCTPACG